MTDESDAARACLIGRFEAYLDAVLERLRGDSRVLGLVGMGSTAERWRVDEWSDHDLAIVVEPGHEDAVRRDRAWLPDARHLVIDVIEWHGGGKLMFDDGRVVEFGVASPDGLREWAVHHYDVLMDRGGVQDAVTAAAESSPRTSDGDLAHELQLVVATVRIGAGKALRGEILAGGEMLRHDAVSHLLNAIAIDSPFDARADLLDPRRRVELTHPAFAATLADAIRRDERTLALVLLDLIDERFASRPEYPAAGVVTVRSLLGQGNIDSSENL